MSKKWFIGKTAAVIAAAAMAVSAVPFASYAAMNMSEFENGYAYSTEMRGLSAFQIVNDMGAGWNLGNSLESSDNETYWGNPATTKSMIDKIAAKGYTTLRVPVRWDDNYSNASTYTINPSYMDRVETVVNYGLANDMYVILNIHHNDLQEKVPETDEISAEMSAVWKQIGERFINYGDKLIFEVNNEPRAGDDWTGNAAYYESVNKCNEAARAAIRATGGNNAKRLVMLPTYCASGDAGKASAWTKNPNDDMIAVSIHAYLPYDFAFNPDGHTEWNDSDLSELKAFFNRMNRFFISKGVPVVLGEFGTVYKLGSNNRINTADRELHATIYGQLARQFAEQDMPCVVWDNNCFYTDGENFGLFNRHSQSFVYDGIVDNMIAAYEGDPVCETTLPAEIFVSEGGTCDSWAQAAKFSGSIIADMTSNQQICANYSTTDGVQLILQSFSNNNKSWVSIEPDSVANGVAVWNYSTIYNKFGNTFDDLDMAYIGAKSASLTVTKVSINNPNPHTHNYNGTTAVTLEATDTTKGRQIVRCSVSGCTAYKVEVIDCAEEPTAEMFTLELPEDLKYDGEAKNAVVKVKSGITGMGEITVKYFDENGNQLSSAPVEQGTYTVKIDVSKGTSYAKAENLVLGTFTIEKAELAITTQPTDYTGKTGDTAKFTVEATSATSYQWQQNTGNGWVSINTTAGRKSSLSIGITATRAKYQYRCVVSDGTNEIISNAVKMIVNDELAITTQPTNFEGKIGETATFKVTATSATSYQWQQNTGNGWVSINTTAGRKSSLSIGVTATRAKYQYRCVVSDGTNEIISNAVKMIVNDELAITTQPTDYIGAIGETAKFTISATGATSYQWQQNTGAGWANINTTAGRSNALSVGIAKFRLNYQYRCIVSDGTTEIVSNAVKMLVEEEFAITTQPTDYTGEIGETAKFTISATGATSYQWQQNTGAGWTNINTSAGRSTALSVGIAEFRLGYQYRCVVSDGTNTIASDEVKMVLE